MQEKKFRKALYKAIDRDGIQNNIFMTHAESAYLPLPPESWAYNDSKENEKNTDIAKQLLSELGYSDNDNNGILEFRINDDEKELVLDILTIDDSIKNDICKTRTI